MPASTARPNRLRRTGQILAVILLAGGLFFALGEVLARSLNLVDRLNGFPRQLYETTDDDALPYVLHASLDTTARGERVIIDENRMRVSGTEAAKPNARRILVLGDSVAFGYRLPFDATLGAKLETEMETRSGKPHHVLNAGVEGYNTQNQLAWLRTYGLAFEPDAVVVVFNLNDYDYGPVMGPNGVLTTNRSERVSTWSLANLSDFYVLLRWLAKLGSSRLLAPAPEPSEAPVEDEQGFLKFDRFISILRKRYYEKPDDERWEQMVEALGGLRDETAGRDIPLLIAILPDGDQIGVSEPNLIPQERLAQICDQERLDCLDLRPLFDAHADERPLFLDIMHPNAKGHTIVAGAVADRLAGAPE
ncbi:MAG: SGNH/GDSL hydrolase family protein [Candidatus Binatia bacterium]|nr:SGNH/GDSL hydrolase family protein [Candidatus Binatia bacterium]